MKLRIGLGQTNPITGDIRGNGKKIIDFIIKAKKENADIAVFPELVITGYCNADRFENINFLKENKQMLSKIAKYTKGIAVILGFVDFDRNVLDESGNWKRYNAAAVCKDGKIIEVIHKTLLPNYGFFDEKRYFTPGEKNMPVEIKIKGKKLKLGILICEDIWDKNYTKKPVNKLCKEKPDLIFVINGSPFYSGKIFERIKVVKEHIKKVKIPFIYVNVVGASDNVKNIIPFDGFSFALNKNGRLIDYLPQFRESLKIVNMDNHKKNKEKRFDYDKDEEIFNALVMSLRDYAKKTGFKKAVLGISGGIDSALVAVIAAKSLGSKNVLGINMPSKYNKGILKNAFRQLSNSLGIDYAADPIQEIVDLFIKQYEKIHGNIEKRVTIENIQARVRGIKLMAISNEQGRLLLATGNKTEIGLGYSTLYGDMAGGIQVIGDLNKLQVYRLANYVNRRFGRVIPKSTILARPDAELWGRSKGDPFDYGIIAPLVDDIILNRRTQNELLEQFKTRKLSKDYAAKIYNLKIKYFQKILKDTYNRVRRSVYKRGQAPPIIIVSKRAFGYDLRESIIDKYF